MNINRSKSISYAAAVILSLFAGAGGAADKTERRKPNIILIYADDLGGGLLGCYGQQIIKTPNIDKLAEDGMRFSNAYGCIYCAPARASLLTGLHSGHKNAWSITKGGLVILQDSGKMRQDEAAAILSKAIQAAPDELFLAEIPRAEGYVTAEVGKLEWGFTTTDKRLKRHGWDYYFGYMDHQRCHGYYPPYLWENGKKVPLPGNTFLDAGKTGEHGYNSSDATRRRRDRTGKQTYSQTVFIKKVLAFIEENRERPFFLYHPTQIPHGPVDVPAVYPDFENDERLNDVQKEYASMVKMLDDNVGMIVMKLKELGIYNNTVIVFTSDNGHELYYTGNKSVSRNRSYHGEGDVFKGAIDGDAGSKWTNWQGGIRVPLIITWPGRISPGAVTDYMCAGYDLMPTIADIVGGEMPAGKDGISFLPILLGKHGSSHKYIIVDNAVLKEDWKLVKFKNKFLLFNLENDPGERKDVAADFPEKLKGMKDIYNREVGSMRKDLKQ